MLILPIVLMALCLICYSLAFIFWFGDQWEKPDKMRIIAIVCAVFFIVFGVIGTIILSNEITANNDNVTNIVADDSNISAHNSELSVSDSKVVINSDNFENLIIVDSNGNEYKIVKAE